MKSSLFIVVYFAIGLFGGWLLGSIAPINSMKPQHIKVEYYLELKPNDKAIIEDVHGNTIQCDMDSIPAVLLKDNL
jgi:hypothetical protein